jgi:hypothetical protein
MAQMKKIVALSAHKVLHRTGCRSFRVPCDNTAAAQVSSEAL